MGGPVLLVIWSGLIGLVALGAFAAALEGYLFARLSWLSRLAITAAIIAVFYPSLLADIVGMAVMVIVISLNWLASRREVSALPVTA